jgi:hypothetical protein
VDDGFSLKHDFGAVRIGSGGGSEPASVATASIAAGGGDADGGPNLGLALVVAAVAGLGAALGAAALQRRWDRPEAADG